MSNGARYAIGTVSGLLGVMVFFSALSHHPSQKPSPTVLFALSAFALCIATACFFRSSLPVTLRIIGAVLCGAGCFSILNWQPDSIRGITFVTGLITGGAWLAVTGKYPSFGAYGSTFDEIQRSNAGTKTNKNQ